MYGLETIRKLSDIATLEARQRDKRPYVPYDLDEVSRLPGGKNWDGHTGFPIPSLGFYVPDGWEETGEQHFVDATGFGSPYEAALTMQQFNAVLVSLVNTGIGLGIVEIGQFQLYVAEFRRV